VRKLVGNKGNKVVHYAIRPLKGSHGVGGVMIELSIYAFSVKLKLLL